MERARSRDESDRSTPKVDGTEQVPVTTLILHFPPPPPLDTHRIVMCNMGITAPAQ
jgi:hypothetical protein